MRLAARRTTVLSVPGLAGARIPGCPAGTAARRNGRWHMPVYMLARAPPVCFHARR